MDNRLRMDVQLPLYLRLVNEGRGQGVYYGLLDGKITRTPRKSDSYPSNREEALSTLLSRAKGSLDSGSFPADPQGNEKVCQRCWAKAVCRKEVQG